MTTSNEDAVRAQSLRVSGLVVARAGQEVLHGVSLEVPAGRTVALLGPNGAGKSTLLRTISGLHRPRTGDVLLGSRSIRRCGPRAITKAGVAHVPEGREIFPRMTVRENLEMGGYTCDREELLSAIAEVQDLFPILAERSNQRAGLLSGGEQQMLAIGRAIVSRPRALMLDEPSMGLAPKVIADVGRAIARIAALGTTILLVEQQVRLALELADYVYVLVNGRVVAEGPASRFSEQKDLAHAYLGVDIGSSAHMGSVR